MMKDGCMIERRWMTDDGGRMRISDKDGDDDEDGSGWMMYDM